MAEASDILRNWRAKAGDATIDERDAARDEAEALREALTQAQAEIKQMKALLEAP